MHFGEVATLPLIIGSLGFGATAIAYAILAALVLSAHPGTLQARWLIAALVVTAFWGGITLAAIWAGSPFPGWLLALDALHVACALTWRADLFVTSDQRQFMAAQLAGLDVRLV